MGAIYLRHIDEFALCGGNVISINLLTDDEIEQSAKNLVAVKHNVSSVRGCHNLDFSL
jgi:hypothetical protein